MIRAGQFYVFAGEWSTLNQKILNSKSIEECGWTFAIRYTTPIKLPSSGMEKI